MKSFLKYVLATVVGIILANIIFILFSLLVLIGIIGTLSLSGSKTIIRENTILRLSLDSPIADRVSGNPLENFDLLSMTPRQQTGLNQILKTIQQAAEDARISGIYLDLSDINANFGALATIEEIRDALLSFKESRKFIYSYSGMGYSQKSYYLATVADSLFVHPRTPLLLNGMSSGVTFYKETLEKIGIKPEVIRVGTYKAAVEPFIDTKMSDANREQMKAYLNSTWGTLLAGISKTRDIPVEKIHALTDNFRLYSPAEFVQEGFFDDVLYEDQMLDKLKRACSIEKDGQLKMTSLQEYQKNDNSTKGISSNKIAIIYAQGEIGEAPSSFTIGPNLAKTIRQAREDESVKAIVLRVNSPGGSALTSDIIWREVQLASETKPLVASMGNVAASGGYYIACAANHIVADPTTLTGSIGIFGLFFSGEKLMTKTLGLHTEVVNTNKHSDFGGTFPLPLPIADRPMTPYEREVMQRFVNEGYDTFLERVSQGRNMTKEQVDKIGQGRIWTGADALSIGLVDQLGGLNEAIQLAAKEAGIEEYQTIELPKPQSLFEEVFLEFSQNVKNRILKSELGEFYDFYQHHKSMLNQQGNVARIPYDITLY